MQPESDNSDNTIVDLYEEYGPEECGPENNHFNGSNHFNESSKCEYNEFHISRVVVVPAVALMILTSILLIYVIAKQLRRVMKLYLSVLFYAACVLFFVSQVITVLLYNRVCDV
jgi:hypothetical protein